MISQDEGLELAASYPFDVQGFQRGGKDYMDPMMLQFDPLAITGYGALIMLGAFAVLQRTIKPPAYAIDISQKQPTSGSLP